VIEEPLALSPLAKKSSENPLVTERFHPIIAGTEMGNGFSELNDPLDQLERFEEQQAARDAGDEEAQMLDRDFVEMLEYGMPPACGWGNSERNFWLLEGVSGREAVPFPLIKRSQSE
jgi:lysyl-tRNA synthetase class 2